MGREGNRLRREFEDLWDAPNAYRPPGHYFDRPQYRAMRVLWQLANFANQFGATAGDATVLAVSLLQSLDARRSYSHGYNDVIDLFESGRLRTVAGSPMKGAVTSQSARVILEMIATAARPEALAEHTANVETFFPSVESRLIRQPPQALSEQGSEPGPAPEAMARSDVPRCADGPDGCSRQVLKRADGQFRCGMHEMSARLKTIPKEQSRVTDTKNLGAAVWKSISGWELVHVLHQEDDDRFLFRTQRGYTYGKEAGGYGLNELATLYRKKKLSLSPERVARVAPGEAVAIIRNAADEPVFADR